MIKLKNILNEKKYTDEDISKYYKQAQKALSELSYAFVGTNREKDARKVDKLLNNLWDIYVKFR